jgi:hypothetical protein
MNGLRALCRTLPAGFLMALLALVSARPALAQPAAADRENARSPWLHILF